MAGCVGGAVMVAFGEPAEDGDSDGDNHPLEGLLYLYLYLHLYLCFIFIFLSLLFSCHHLPLLMM